MNLLRNAFRLGAMSMGWATTSGSQTSNAAQEWPRPVRISQEPACSACSVVVEKIATLGRETDREILSGTRVVAAQASNGVLFAAVASHLTANVLVFDSTGRFRQVIGRRGRGPGEFESINVLAVGPGDSLYVSQSGNRISIFTARGTFVREVKPAVIPTRAILPLSGGGIAATGTRSTPAEAGYAVHRLRKDGSYDRPLCGLSPIQMPNNVPSRDREIAHGQNGDVWAIEPANYRIERCAPDGSVAQVLTRDAPWMWPAIAVPPAPGQVRVRVTTPPRSTPGAPPPAVKPVPRPATRIRALWVDESGHLFVAATIPDSAWEAAARIPDIDPLSERLYDSMIDVIDPVSGTLIASKRLPFGIHTYIGNGLVSNVHSLPSGLVEVTVWRVRLIRP